VGNKTERREDSFRKGTGIATGTCCFTDIVDNDDDGDDEH